YGNTHFRHCCDDLCPCHLRNHAVDHRTERAVICEPCLHLFKAGIVCEFGEVKYVAKIFPLLLIGDGDVYKTVLRLKRFVRNDRRMTTTCAFRRTSSREINQGVISEGRHHSIQKADIDVLTPAGFMTRE